MDWEVAGGVDMPWEEPERFIADWARRRRAIRVYCRIRRWTGTIPEG